MPIDESVIGPPDDPAHDPLPTTAPTEPAMTIGAWTALISLAIGILADLGLPLTDAQQRWVYLLAVFFGPVVSGLLTRNKVFAPSTVDQITQSLHWRLRSAELDASDAIATQKVLEALYPALHAILDAQQAPLTPTPGPLPFTPQQPAQPSSMFTPYARLTETQAIPTTGPQPFTPGRHRQD